MERGAQPGNQNGTKEKKMFNAALRRALVQGPERVVAIAEKLISLAEQGEQWAVKELFDRVDGKAPVAIVGDDDAPPVRVEKVVREIVRGTPNPNG